MKKKLRQFWNNCTKRLKLGVLFTIWLVFGFIYIMVPDQWFLIKTTAIAAGTALASCMGYVYSQEE